MELGHQGFGDVQLIEGERVESVLNLTTGEGGGGSGRPDLVVLTDRRIIQLQGNEKRRNVFFASIQDIESVEILGARLGFSAFIWAALAFILAGILYGTLDNSSAVTRGLAAGAVAAMGIYLIASHLLEPGRVWLIFKTRSSEFRLGLKRDHALTEVYGFINRLFQLKSAKDLEDSSQLRRFSPR